MKSFSRQFAVLVAGLALLTTAAYAQTPGQTVDSGPQAIVHHAHPAYSRHAYHTGTAHHAAAIYNQAASSGSSYLFNGASGSGLEGQPLYDAAAVPAIAQPGIACLGGRGVGYYPNPIAYGESAATTEAGGEFILDRGYRGCFVIGE